MSNVPPPPQDSFVAPQLVEKPGMSTGVKVIVILGIVGLVLLAVCCGGGIFLSFWASSYMKDAVTEDPVVIARRQAEILDIEIPESFAPQTSIDMAVPMTDKRLMTIVAYRGESPGDSIVLVGIGDMLSEMPQQDMEQQIQESLRQQGINQGGSESGWETEEKEFTIAGKPTTFVYRIAKDAEGEPQRLEVSGIVAGKRGPVMITISASAEKLSEDEIDQIVGSIK